MEEYQLSEGDQHAEETREEDCVCERSDAVSFSFFPSYISRFTKDYYTNSSRLDNIGLSIAEKIEEIGMFSPPVMSTEKVVKLMAN